MEAQDRSQDRRIGPYRILGVLGRGGMGVVYRAEHHRTGRSVALKTIRGAREGLLASLWQEIHALVRLRHPGIVPILGQGVQDALPWYAMELVEGSSLRGWMQKKRGGPGGLGEMLTLALRLCGALGYLHGEGLVHRDLKPENVIVRADGTPVLVDFGLVSKFGSELSRESLAVEVGSKGTFACMAPEQWREEVVDARADLYALGCLLFEMVTGRPVFSSLNQVDWMAAHLHRKPRAPSSLVPGVPEGLEALILRLLEKDPRKRLGYAGDVAERLRRLGAGSEPEGPPPRAYLYRPGFAGREPLMSSLNELSARLRPKSPRGPGETSPGGGPGGSVSWPPEASAPPALVLLSGVSGSGKTRLLRELGRREAAEGTRVLSGKCVPLGGGKLGGLLQPLRALGDRCREKGLEETERIFGEHGPLLSRYEPSLANLPGQAAYPRPPELPPEEAEERLYQALCEAFLARTRPARARTAGARIALSAPELPLLLLLDDLQWADELTLGFLGFWAERFGARQVGARHAVPLPAVPMLIVGTYRVEEAGGGLARLLELEGVRALEVGPLEDEAVAWMIRDMLALEEVSAPFARSLEKSSEGSPFFVAEYLRAAVAGGLLARDEHGRWRVAEPAEARPAASEARNEALPLPSTVLELVLRRLQGLPDSALRLVEAAAVLGRESELELLGSMVLLGDEALYEALSELLRRQILEVPTPGLLRFAQEKIREVAYARLPPPRRRALHQAAAEAIVGARLDAAFPPERQAALDAHRAALRSTGEPAGLPPGLPPLDG